MSNINWADVIKKEARGKTDKDDLGKVQKVWDNHILTVKGILKKTYFYISKELVECFDGQILRFKVTEREKDAKEVIINKSPTVEECQSSSSSTNSPLSQSSKNGQTDDHVIKDLEDSNAMVEKQSQIKETIAEKEIADVSLVFREIPFRALPYKHIVKPLPFRIMPILTLTLMPLPLPNIIAREVEKSLITNTKVTIPLKHEETVAPLIIENPSLIEEIIEKRESMAETKRIKDEILREIINSKI
ncbi:MAG: hypothetical protein M3227_00665 [Thermoproteota archaeon]|nr:hypothetical protein [Thermoproteota archaeon]